MIDRRYLLAGLLAGAATTAEWLRPRRAYAVPGKLDLAAMIPAHVAGWDALEGVSLVLNPEVEAAQHAVYDGVVTRAYADPAGRVLMLLIAYSQVQNGMLQLHRPESCYPAQGFTLTPGVPARLRLGGRTVEAATATATSPSHDRIEHLLYWTRIGPRFPIDFDGQRAAVIAENLGGSIPDGALVRVSLIGDEPRAALEAMTAFLNALVARLPERGRDAMLGHG